MIFTNVNSFGVFFFHFLNSGLTIIHKRTYPNLAKSLIVEFLKCLILTTNKNSLFQYCDFCIFFPKRSPSLIRIVFFFITIIVATLALGSRLKQRGYKSAGQEEVRESHHILPGV